MRMSEEEYAAMIHRKTIESYSASPKVQQMIDTANGKAKPKRASAFKHRIQIGRSSIMLTDEGLEQYTVAQWLRLKDILFLHIPNERKCSAPEMVMLKAMGLEPGANDLLIFDVTWKLGVEGYTGVAIEMKSATGKLQDNQKVWLEKMAQRKWLTAVCHGSAEAISLLTEWGF